MSATTDNVVVVNGQYGARYELAEGWTLDLLKSSAAMASLRPKPLRCKIKHKNEVVGELYQAPMDGPLIDVAASLIQGSFYDVLLRCKRCGAVRERYRP
jgi:hypothetical protein